MKAFTTKEQYQDKVQHQYDKIIKSPNDNREYRGLILTNEMKVLLISDPTTDKSAASMDINVGSLSDPPELPGLAHFCEHMLFLGSKKYPQESDYDMYIYQHGGSSNAGTGANFTNYYFDLNPDNLEGALDRFSQFFLEPLFTENSTEREKKAVNAEYEKNLAEDFWRISQVDKFSANQNHPYSGFSTGNIETLEIIPKTKNIDVRQELLNFYKKWYSANIMSLSVLGKESLDDLEKMVVKLFANVENKNVETPKWTEQPFNEEQFQCKWYIVPITNMRNLIVTFPIPDLQKYFHSAPTFYLLHLFGHEGEGSLYSILKAKGWSLYLRVGKSESGFAFFYLEFALTAEGLNHVDDIITLIFQYINMLRKEGPKEWIFNECAAIEKINFRFMEKWSPKGYVHSVAKSLQKYPIEEVLSAPYLLTEWKPELINSIIDNLTPENIRVQVLAQVYENIATEVEPWYQTKFKRERIPANVIEKWSNAGLCSDFKLPGKNEFIPTEFDLKLDNRNIDKYPVIVKETPMMRVWFKQDDEFLLPKANLIFQFVSPLAYFDPKSCNNNVMFARLVKDSLSEYSYAAKLAGLNWDIEEEKYGIKVTVKGYNHKQHILLSEIIDKMTNFEIDETRFRYLKESYIRELKNFETLQPNAKAIYHLAFLIVDKAWHKVHLLDASAGLTVESVRDFVSQMFTKMHVECLIHGNFRKDETLTIASLVESKLTSRNNSNKGNISALLPSQLALDRVISLEAGRHFLYEIKDETNEQSCTLVYYQSGLQSTRSTMLLELFTQIISEPAYRILRTQEQLGYNVICQALTMNGAQGFCFIVESDRHPHYLEERIDNFMELMKERIKNMSDEEFGKHKESLAGQLSERPTDMKSESVTFWNEISSKEYNFDRANIQVELLNTITKDEIRQFYEDVVDKNSKFQKKLSIHSISIAKGGLRNETGATMKSEKEQPIRIEDIDSFKASQFLYPILQPFINAREYLDSS